MPSRTSSHIVRRAPCSQGRVSPANTRAMLPFAVAGADHAERGAVTGRRERAGVAMGQHADAAAEQVRAELAHVAVRGEVLVLDRLRFAARAQSTPPRARAGHAIERPHEIHRRRPRRAQQSTNAASRLRRIVLRGRDDAPGRRDADRGRAAHGEIADRRRDVGGGRGTRCRFPRTAAGAGRAGAGDRPARARRGSSRGRRLRSRSRATGTLCLRARRLAARRTLRHARSALKNCLPARIETNNTRWPN